MRMWKILTEQMDMANTTVGRLTLFWQFSQMHPVPGQSINTYFSQLLNITNQLAGTPEAVPDMVLKNHIFTTLLEMLKINIKMLQSRADVTVQQVLNDLKKCEQNEALATKLDAVSEALYSQYGGRGGGRGGRGGRGNHRGGLVGHGDQRPQKRCSCCSSNTHNFEICWKKDGSNKRPQDGDQETRPNCYGCGEMGHIKRNCPKRRHGNGNGSGDGSGSGFYGQGHRTSPGSGGGFYRQGHGNWNGNGLYGQGRGDANGNGLYGQGHRNGNGSYHEPGATGSLPPAPVPLSPLSPCGSSSFPLPQPRSSSVLRRLDRSPPYRSGSDIPDRWPVLTSLLCLHYVTCVSFSCHRYVCCFLLIMLARPFACPLRLLSPID